MQARVAPCARSAASPLVHPGVDSAAVVAVREIEIEKRRARFAERARIRPCMQLAGECPLDEPLHAVADPPAYECFAPRWNPEPWHDPVDAPSDVGDRVDEGSVEIERDESRWGTAEDVCRLGRIGLHAQAPALLAGTVDGAVRWSGEADVHASWRLRLRR